MTLQAARSAVVLLSMLFTLVAAIAIPTTQQCNLQGREDVPSGLVFFSCPTVTCDDLSSCEPVISGPWEAEVWYCSCGSGPATPLIACRAVGRFDVDPADPTQRSASWTCYKELCTKNCKVKGVPLPLAPTYLCGC